MADKGQPEVHLNPGQTSAAEDMKNHTPFAETTTPKTRQLDPRIKTLIFVLEIVFIIVLLVWWLSSDSAQKSTNLLVLFLYCFPAEFLIATVPHEPVLLYFGKLYSPLTVALVSIAGTALTEVINYSVFKFMADLKLFKKMLASKVVQKIVGWFKRAPFLALLVAGFTPVPFYPFRFLVVLARYPLTKYISAVILSRTPRFFLLALFGHAVKIPDYLLILLFAVLIIVANFPIVRELLKKRRKPSPPLTKENQDAINTEVNTKK